MTLKHQVRLMLQRAGLDVTRFPGDRREHRRVLLLRSHDVTLVLDVGANHGQYGAELRRFGYTGEIVSFEPLHGPWQSLAARADADGKWRVVRCAAGATEGELTMNVAGNSGASSSVLPMLDIHKAAAPGANYVGQETVTVRRLDDVVPPFVGADDTVFLKVDVQGYERDVLAGAEKLLETVVGVQLELSLVPLYDGALDYREALNLLAEKGYVLQGLEPGFSDPRTGQLLQADGIFFRTQA